jgi:hypothetical protein
VTEFTTKDSGERHTFSSGMNRDVTTGKTRWDLVADGPMLRRWADLMTRGAVKYDARNWMRANGEEEYARFRESAFRHFIQWYMGETDEDHGAATMFNINGAEFVKAKIEAAKVNAATSYNVPPISLTDAIEESLLHDSN